MGVIENRPGTAIRVALGGPPQAAASAGAGSSGRQRQSVVQERADALAEIPQINLDFA
jgi:hypothetical protein